MICMVQGDLTVLNINHAITASKTGSLAGIAFVITSSFAAINNKWVNAWLTGVLTMCADVIVHPTHLLLVDGSRMYRFGCCYTLLPTGEKT